MFVIEVPFFNLDQIYNSGQVFRWIKLREQKYVIPYKNQALKIEQVKERLIMSCSEEQFFETWFNYFDMANDYAEINYKSRSVSAHLKACAVRGSGVRILHQDLFEMIITFALATATSIPRIRSMVKSLCEVCGCKHEQSMREAGRVTWYEFPTPQDILDNAGSLERCKMGYRKDTVISLCKDVVEGWLDLDMLAGLDYEEAKQYLMQFNGIGPKVADCICLYGLHHLQAFPVDTHISQVTEKHFGCDAEIFAEWFLDGVLLDNAGVVQQYLFYDDINPPKEMQSWD